MNKQNSTIYYLGLLKDFFRDKLSLTGCIGSLIILFVSFFAFIKKEPLYFFPDSANTRATFYNDKIDGGKSVISDTLITDTCLSVRFVLKDGFVSPYVGISIENKFLKRSDVSLYNRLKITASGEGVKSVFIYLVLEDSSIYFKGSPLGVRHLNQQIQVSPKRSTFKLKMNNFKTPDWWFDKYNINPSTIDKPNFNHIQRISIATGLAPQLIQSQSFSISSIVFYNDYALVLWTMLLIQLLVISIFFAVFYYRNKPKKKLTPITVNYIPISIPNKNEKATGFLDYINNNFHNAELSLDLISKQTGHSQRTISEGISSQFQCNVKTYINQIRVNEAMRLLKETDLNISEIAYKVGFSSPSNFNRVFKNLTGKTPSDFLLK